MLIKDLQSNTVYEYGNDCHDSLAISQDGRSLSYYNLQCGDGSRYGDYRFVMEDGEVPQDSDTPDAIHAECYFDIGGKFGNTYSKAYEQGKADAIKELPTMLYCDGFNDGYAKGRADMINAIKNDLHDRLTEEMNNPFQDQSLCQGLYYSIQKCDWYLNDDKEQKNEQNIRID